MKIKSIHKIFALIDEKLLDNRRIVIAIDGKAASGKTTIAQLIENKYNATIIHVDDFYKKRDFNMSLKLDEMFDGNIDYDRFNSSIITKLDKEFLTYIKFNCKKQDFEEPEFKDLKKVVVIEGTYSLNPKLGEYYDLSFFLDINDEVQKGRLFRRDPMNFDNFINAWVKLERNYFDKYKIQEKAQFIVDGNELI